jgi:hypothetical protein
MRKFTATKRVLTGFVSALSTVFPVRGNWLSTPNSIPPKQRVIRGLRRSLVFLAILACFIGPAMAPATRPVHGQTTCRTESPLTVNEVLAPPLMPPDFTGIGEALDYEGVLIQPPGSSQYIPAYLLNFFIEPPNAFLGPADVPCPDDPDGVYITSINGTQLPTPLAFPVGTSVPSWTVCGNGSGPTGWPAAGSGALFLGTGVDPTLPEALVVLAVCTKKSLTPSSCTGLPITEPVTLGFTVKFENAYCPGMTPVPQQRNGYVVLPAWDTVENIYVDGTSLLMDGNPPD